MEVVRASSGSNDSARPRALRLPPEIVERAAQSLCWVSIVCAVTSVVTFMLQNYLQPEMAAMLAHPFQRLTTLGLVFLSLGFLVVLRAGWVSKEMLLDVGTAFRVVVAFAIGVYETGMPITADTPVRGLSGVAVWMVFTGFLLPNSPLKAGLAAAGSDESAFRLDVSDCDYGGLELRDQRADDPDGDVEAKGRRPWQLSA